MPSDPEVVEDMIPILYEKDEVVFASNGICRLTSCLSCVVTEERNGIYECDFEYPVNGAYYDQIECGRVIGCTHDDTGDVQPFDIVSCSKPINGVVSFHAVHISYRLTEHVAKGTEIKSLAAAFAMLENSTPSNPFTFEADFTSSSYMASADGVPRSVRQYLGGIEGSILDAYGGEYEFDRFNVKLWRHRGELKDFTIRYGLNLVDYNEDVDYFGTYTSAIPYWVGNDGAGGQTIVVGAQVTSGLESYNGRDICAAIDLSDKFSEKPTAAQLQNFVRSQMQSRNPNVPSQNISVDFIRLQDTTEFSAMAELLECALCDTVRVVFPRYNMQGTFKIVKTVYDVFKERFVSMELGDLSTSLSQALGISNSLDSKQEVTVNTTSSTSTYGTLSAREVSGVVSVSFSGKAVAYTTGKWVTVGTLPAGFRPADRVNGLGVNNTSYSSTTAAIMYRISTDGTVAVWVYSNISGNVQAHFNCSFVK